MGELPLISSPAPRLHTCRTLGHSKFAEGTNFCPGEEFNDVEDKDTYRAMLARDERRFKAADKDADGIATRNEFTAFLHPEEFDYMKDVVVQVQ